MAAWLRLVPRQHSSSQRRVLLGISKRGDPYLRTFLIHGARSVMRRVKDTTSWLYRLLQGQGKNKAFVC